MIRLQNLLLTATPSERPIGLRALAAATGQSIASVSASMPKLARRGLVERTGKNRALLWRRTAAGDAVVGAGTIIDRGPVRGIARRAPRPSDLNRQDTFYDRAWAALRMMRKATVPELLELAARDEVAAAPNLRRYLKRLARYGVLRRMDRRDPGIAANSRGFLRYLLVLDLGPRSPLWRDAYGFFDRNSGQPLLLPPPPEAATITAPEPPGAA